MADISVGDKIRFDIDSVGHGIEAVTVAHVGTQVSRTNLNLAADASVGGSNIKVRNAHGFCVGDEIIVGNPTNRQTVNITGVGAASPNGTSIGFAPALTQGHINSETVVNPVRVSILRPASVQPFGESSF